MGKKMLDPLDFQNFTISRRTHWEIFTGMDIELFGRSIDPDKCDLKVYQDLLVFSFIKNNIPQGSRILDIGGGDSRILRYFSKQYDCWNIDKLEGKGNGPKELSDTPYKLILDYMGNFNSELPDSSFDFVFSISALEHVPEDSAIVNNIIQDIKRVLKPGGYGLHLLDVRIMENNMWTNKIIYSLFESFKTFNKFEKSSNLFFDEDLYFMSQEHYDKTWIRTTNKSYKDFGKPASLNVLFQV